MTQAKRIFTAGALLCWLASQGCGSSSGESGEAGVPDSAVTTDAASALDGSIEDASARDAGGYDGNVYQLDGAVLDGCPPSMIQPCDSPVPPGCLDHEICDNGLDDNCNGQVNENCSCARGQVRECFLGPPAYANLGACRFGTMTCTGDVEFGHWGPCEGGIWPTAEVCDNLDNDCNGCVDDQLCCEPEGSCPSEVPDAEPLVPYGIDGTLYYPGTALTWQWTVQGGPCDDLLGNSFTVTGETTATPEILFTLSGDYTVTMTVTTPTGVFTCTFVVHVAGPGLRVELCWEGTGTRDIDLHLLREDLHRDYGANWCDLDYDCYFANCRSVNWNLASWGYGNTPVQTCAGGPLGALPAGKTCSEYPYSLFWSCRGYCANPRLDVDNVNRPGVPENANVDEPGDGDVYRIMVHYYYGSGPAHPLVNVYCDGHRIATYGLAPDTVDTFTTSGWQCNLGHTWRVADVGVSILPGGVTSCTATPLRTPGGGWDVRLNDDQYD